MSTISTEQAKDLRNAFKCWQQDYDPVEDKEQYEMFGLGVVAMDELLALRKEREKAEPVEYQYYYHNHGTGTGEWLTVKSKQDFEKMKAEYASNNDFSFRELYTAPPAPSTDDDSLPYDPQIAEYEQLMEAEQAQSENTSQQFELLASVKQPSSIDAATGKASRGSDTNSSPDSQATIKQSDGWIPCSERMPETYVNVLLTDEHGDTCIGQLESFEDSHFYISSSIHRYKATHWQPLPEPPCK
ncbi:DUF551 domain-containing protein [Cronobacter dublinensis]